MAPSAPRAEAADVRQIILPDVALTGNRDAPAGAYGDLVLIQGLCTALALAAASIGLLGTQTLLIGAGIAILIFGLPHGTLDAAVFRASARHHLGPIVALYLMAALAMYWLWQSHPGIALTVFVALAVVHFAEDWRDALPPLFSHGISLAIVTAPSIFHRDSLAGLFGALVGADANALVDAATLLAPAASAMALVATIWLWTDGLRDRAVATALAVLGMVILPPVIGFALFFCLMHSPVQFRAGLRAVGWTAPQQWTSPVALLTLAAMAIAVAIFAALPTADLSQRVVSAVFVTLSVLTLPHMLAPFFVSVMQRLSPR